VKIQIPARRQFGSFFALGALTMALAVSGADRSVATAASGQAARGQNSRTGQATPSQASQAPAKPDPRGGPQQPRLPWWKDPAIVKAITLTPDQASRIDAIWTKREKAMAGNTAEMKKQQDELNRMLAERKVGIDVIGVQFDRVEAQRTTLNKSRAIALYQTSQILSAEQNKALQDIFERNRRDRR
jgi:Spy/CpxP family protein refolding chaperone